MSPADGRVASTLCGGSEASYALPAPVDARGGPLGLARALDAARGRATFVRELSDPVERAPFLVAASSLRTAGGERLAALATGGESVAVFGDYDVDGVTSTVSLTAALAAARLGEAEAAALWEEEGLGALAFLAGLDARVPERREGYGLSVAAVRRYALAGFTDLVCVDNGTNALDALALATASRLRVLVVDHHPPCEEALLYWSRVATGDRGTGHVLVNPWVEGPLSELALGLASGRDLCACVVVEALIAEASSRLGRFDPWSPAALRRATLCAVASVADMMPLVGANRGLVREGLASLDVGHGPPGLNALRDGVLAARSIGPSDGVMSWQGCALDGGFVGFQVAPRINACGRMGRAAAALSMVGASRREADSLARGVEDLNLARRRVQDETIEEALAFLGSAAEAADPLDLADAAREAFVGTLTPLDVARAAGAAGDASGRVAFALLVPGVLCLFASSAMSEGIAGLVASRLAETWRCPAIALAGPHGPGGAMSGSGRVPASSPLAALGAGASRAIVAGFGSRGGSGGGHAAAFGLRLRASPDPRERFSLVREAVSESACRLLNLLGSAIADGRLVPESVEVERLGRVDLSVAPGDEGAVALACLDLGPFGHGVPEPTLHCEVGPGTLRPIGSKGTAVIEPAAVGAPRMLVFPSVFGDVPLELVAARVAAGSCSVVGTPKRSFYGKGRYARGGDRWGGPSLEIEVAAILEDPRR